MTTSPPDWRHAEVLVCCGAGGVGKTTVAAALGIGAARAGRHVVVVTIDPARRLADALGVPGGLSGEPRPVALAGGDLWAMMLDTPAMFERVVRRHAATPAQAARIIENRFYRNVATALGGTQEYMASEALYELRADPRFDLVIVDTPPSRNALDFLEAPGVLTRFLEHPVFRLLMLPTRTGMRFLSVAGQPILHAIGRVVGSDVLADATAFFQSFAGMEQGFRERAAAVSALLAADTTRFVLVAGPRADTVDEACWFADALRRHQYGVAAVIANRVMPAFGDGSGEAADEAALAADADGRHDQAAMWRNLAELRRHRHAQSVALEPLRAHTAGAEWVEVPQLPGDVHDVESLEHVVSHVWHPKPA